MCQRCIDNIIKELRINGPKSLAIVLGYTNETGSQLSMNYALRCGGKDNIVRMTEALLEFVNEIDESTLVPTPATH